MRLTVVLVVSLLPAAAGGATPTPTAERRQGRDAGHPVMEVLKQKDTPVTDEQLDQLKHMPFESIWAAVKGKGYNSYYTGLKPTRPEARLVGRALTMRYLPQRPDLDEAMRTLARQGDWPVGYHIRAAEQAKRGDVLVVDLGGGIADGVFFGDISALGAKMAGARGAVLYGASRDLGELRQMQDFPVFAVGFHPNPATQIGVDWNVPIRVGTATVLPGDVVVAEEEAVLFFPPQIAADVIQQCHKSIVRENYERDLVRQQKYRFRDVYPLNAELQKKFDEEQKKRQPY